MSDTQEQQPLAPVLNEDTLNTLGTNLFKKFEQYQKDRWALEDQWLKNLRQFRGIYDPEIIQVLAKDRSRAFPKITRKKVINTVSRLMEMLFPQTEKNWGLEPSPLPDLPVGDMQVLLDSIGIPADGQPLSEQDVEKAVMEIAKARCERMTTLIDDQLSELDWISLARRVIFSGVLYGAGIVKGPLVLTKKQTAFRFDPQQKKYVAYEVKKFFPYFEFVPVWSYYPDLSAKTRKATDDYFERHVMSRQQVLELADREDFLGDRVRKFLTDNPTGNFKELWWETMLRTDGDKKNQGNLEGRKYQGGEFWGYVSGHELAAAGVVIAPEKYGELFEAVGFMLGNVVVKCKMNPYKKKARPDHIFVYEDDDINLMGSGLPPVVRDSQMAICESARMALDNASAVCGPMMEVNASLLMPGQDLAIHAYKVWLREDEDRAGVPAVREIRADSHIAELQGMIELFMGFADDETALPPTSTGDISRGGSEAVRTQGNMSMVMSAAALPIRDTVRNFDTFTQSVIGALNDWNMQFSTDASVKGDFKAIARGSTSLIAKEVRAYAMDSFKATVTPDELPYLKPGVFLKERAKARDIPKEVFEDDDMVKKKLDAQAAAAQKQEQQADTLAMVQVKKIMSDVVKNVAAAEASGADSKTNMYKVLMEAVNAATANESKPSASSKAA